MKRTTDQEPCHPYETAYQYYWVVDFSGEVELEVHGPEGIIDAYLTKGDLENMLNAIIKFKETKR